LKGEFRAVKPSLVRNYHRKKRSIEREKPGCNFAGHKKTATHA